MIDNYINERKQLLNKNKERNNYIFGLIFGLILLLLNAFIFLSAADIPLLNYINISLMILGILFILLATIYPNALNLVHIFFNLIANFIGNIIFKVILTLIYLILIIPIGLIIRVKRKKEILNIDTNFIDYNNSDTKLNNNKGIFNILRIFKLFSNEHYVLMLPLIIILITIGILLIFVQSSVIAPFIYTLF